MTNKIVIININPLKNIKAERLLTISAIEFNKVTNLLSNNGSDMPTINFKDIEKTTKLKPLTKLLNNT